MRQYVLYIVISTVVLYSCSCETCRKAADNQRAKTTGVYSAIELPLPEVPSDLTAPAERAGYIMEHFWDGMDFGDTLRSHDFMFMELNLVNFMSLFPHGDEQACSRSIGSLLGKTAADTVAFNLVTDIMERYLDDPNSPMRDENSYILYLEELLRQPGLSEYDRIRPAYKLATARKNRPGMTATDFAYIDRSGHRQTLHSTAADRRLLLLFYDPDCGHCSEILRQVSESAVITGCIGRNELAVLAVYTEGNRELWEKTKSSMLQEWTVGFDTDSIVERELYSIPAMPVMYLLDSDKKVLLKDTSLPDIEERLTNSAMNDYTDEHKHEKRGAKPETEIRYKEALELYGTTSLPVKEICRRTQIPIGAFRSYIHRTHRELMFARYGVSVTPEEALSTQLRKSRGQTAASSLKYGDAIRACDDMTYIEYNVSQIARIFHLDPSALGRQLRVHFPEILERREKERHRLGVNDNLHRGVKRWCREQYAEAVEHLRTTNDTIQQTARLYKLSYSGLREHMLYYHKDIVGKRFAKRKKAKSVKKRGALTGNGTRHEPSPRQVEKYKEAIYLYKVTAMTQKEIVAATGVPLNGLRNYLRIWHPELILEHRGVMCDSCDNIKISETKSYLKSTAAKYAGAIKKLKTTGQSTAEVAREFGLNPETFRMYLHEHEPELAACLGMTLLPNGKRVSARSMEKYAGAIRLYETTEESLRSIARRLGLVYNSISGFIRRNCPESIERHNRIVEHKDTNLN